MIFDFSISEQKGYVVINLQGELIEKNQANDMMAKVEEMVTAGHNKFALNMADLKYMNSSGLNTLIQLLTKARRTGGDTVIYNMNKKINELLLITKLNTLFKVMQSEDEVQKALGA